MARRRFTPGSLPVAERRHLLEEGTLWVTAHAATRRVLLRGVHGDEVAVAFLRRQSLTPPRVSMLPLDSFLRNYQREDEA